MIQRKALFRLSVGLLLIGVFGSILLNTLDYFPHATAFLLSMPIASYDTVFLVGWMLSGVTIAGLITLFFSLRHHQLVTTFACLIAIIVTPHLL